MNQTVKIRDLTGTEQTYSNIPYIKVKDSNAAEHIFINTSDANILASDVSVGATAYGSDGSLIQGTYDGGSTGVSINGIIAAYKVDAGENISAGDFVSFVNKALSIANSCSSAPSAILLETNKVFIAHSYGSDRYLYGTIVTIDGTTMTPVTTQLSAVTNSCYYAPSAILLEDNKVFIAHAYDSSNRYLYGTIITISGTTMTPVTTQLSAVTYSCYFAPSAILLEDNKVFIAHVYTFGDYYLYGTIVTINGTMMTPVTTRLSTVTNSCRYSPSAILLETNKVFIAHTYDTSRYLYGTIVTIDGTTMTPVTTQLSAVTYSCYFAPSAILLETNKVFIAHSYTSDRYLYGTIVTINGTMMTPVTTRLSTVTNSCRYSPSAILLEDNKVFIAHVYSNNYYLYGTIVTINGTTMTAVTTQLSAVTYSCYHEPSAILLEDNKVFIAHAYTSSDQYLYGTIITIDGTTIAVTSESTVKEHVKKDLVTPKGVAAQSGAAGDTINCYTPPV
jgi:hypothetical protein